MAEVKVALLQMVSEGSNQTANLEKADHFCRRASAMGADVALMPEMWNIGYTKFDLADDKEQWQLQAVPADGDWVGHFVQLARELKMAIAITYLEQCAGAPRNTVSVIDRTGAVVLTYAKVHTCDFGMMESACTPGDGFHVAELSVATGTLQVGAMICYDREFPEAARCLMLGGAELILTPNACELDDFRMHQFQTRAFENAVGVAMTNYAAPQLNGRSAAFDVGGHLIVQAGGVEGIYPATFDLDAMREYRRDTIWGNAFRRPHRYSAITRPGQETVFERTNGFDELFLPEER